MKKSEVVKILQRNRTRHVKEYDKAVVGFKKKSLKALEKATKQIAKGSLTLSVGFPTPINREDYFTNVISMFQHDVRPEIEMTQQEYNEYILDKGHGAVAAFSNNSMYFSKGSAKKI